MPHKPLKPCKFPQCANLTNSTYCEKHAREKDGYRPNANARGYNRDWQEARRLFLTVNPWCYRCKMRGEIVRAVVVDHIKPHRGDQSVFWDEKNWQPLCKSCHDRKTKTDDRYQEYKY